MHWNNSSLREPVVLKGAERGFWGIPHRENIEIAKTFCLFPTLQIMDEAPAATAGRSARGNMTRDEALMLEFQRGSREAFEELFSRYQEPLYGFFRRRVDSRERAEDLVQETFAAVIRATSRYEPRALFRTYLYGIAFKLLAADRRKQARSALSAESGQEPARDNPLDAALWVRQALHSLDPSEREILMLREYEQLSYAEIAELLRLPLSTVRSRLFRSRTALKSFLEPAEKLHDAARASERTDGTDLRRSEDEA
jgi:RNA polymerase sigma factor (sigma-70 family)